VCVKSMSCLWLSCKKEVNMASSILRLSKEEKSAKIMASDEVI